MANAGPLTNGLGALLLVVALLLYAERGSARSLEMRPESVASTLDALLPSSTSGAIDHALKQIGRSGDQRFLAPLTDIERFADSSTKYAAPQTRIRQTVEALTEKQIDLPGAQQALEGMMDSIGAPNSAVGAQLGWTIFERLVVWYGKHPELSSPPGYDQWKGRFYAKMVDPQMARFFYRGEPAIVRVGEVVWGGVKVGGIPALVNPRMIKASAAGYLRDDEPVFGVSINGDDRAYPQRIMDWHEMADDVVGGHAIALSYCTLCGSAILYDTSFDGRLHVFDSSGFLFRSNKLMYDRETWTLWNQFTGEPVIGKLAGGKVQLEMLPVVVTSWSQWRHEHPSTLVLDPDTGYKRPYVTGAPYGGYFGSPDTMFPVWRRSSALPDKALVYGVQIGGRAKAYPLDALNRTSGVINDTVGGDPIVVVYRDAIGPVALPAPWRAALEARDGKTAAPELANDLSADLAQSLMIKQPALADSLTAPVLLAMPADTRLLILADFTSSAPDGNTDPGMIPRVLRDQVAERGMIGEARVYERGTHSFSRTIADGQFVDEGGAHWQMSEPALVSESGERLKRLPGHLSYWFGWYEFFPASLLYSAPATAPKSNASAAR